MKNKELNIQIGRIILAGALTTLLIPGVVFAKNKTLIASGTGQTSRVDALKQAIEKANTFGSDLNGAVMASDAFFPFPDCVEIAKNAGITAVIQPGGSIKDELSINYCNENKVAMVFTGTRHFKH